MEDLGNKYAMAALKKRRAEIAGEITTLKKQLVWRTHQLDSLDATILIFDPDIDPSKIPVARPRHRTKLFRQGELGRTITDAIRRAGKPLGTHEIVTTILNNGGHHESARPALTPRVRGNLAYLEKAGKVVKSGSAASARWSLPV